MWRAVNEDGSLTYSFVGSRLRQLPYWFGRFIGGVLFLSGMIVMLYNVLMTVNGKKAADADTL